jgi:uncharacterized protein HemY
LTDQPERYQDLLLKATDVDPSLYYTLGDYVLARKQDDKAATYFEKGAAKDPDSLRAAAYASWRIRYYLKKGQKEKARSIAHAAADV